MSAPSLPVRHYCEQRGFSRAVRDGGFDYLLRRWENIVGKVSTGYNALFVEFLNDMDTRRILAELLPLANDEERAKVQALIPKFDEKFFRETRPIEHCIWGNILAEEYRYDSQRDWWYYRIPINLDGVYDRDQWP